MDDHGEKMLEEGISLLALKVKHHLFTTIGKTIEDATSSDLYYALSLAFREEVMLHWFTKDLFKVS